MNAGQQLYPILKTIVGEQVYQVIKRTRTNADGQPLPDAVPYVVYAPISTVPETSQQGYAGFDWTRVQIDVYHNNYDALDAVVNEIITAIDKNIRPSELGTRQHLYDAETELFRQSFDYEFFTDLVRYPPPPTP